MSKLYGCVARSYAQNLPENIPTKVVRNVQTEPQLPYFKEAKLKVSPFETVSYTGSSVYSATVQTTSHVLAFRSSLPTLSSKPTSPLQMYPPARVDIRNPAVGLCEALSHANPSTSPIQNPTLPCQRPLVCLQPPIAY